MKKITRKAGRKKQHVSLHQTYSYDLNNEGDREDYFAQKSGRPEEQKELLIFELTEEINHHLRFIESKLEGQTFVDNYNIDYAKFHHSIVSNEELSKIPYLTFASSCIKELSSVRYDLLNREVDSLAFSLVGRMLRALRDAACQQVAELEHQYLAGRARTSGATLARTMTKQELINLVTPWINCYKEKDWSQPRIVTTISRRLKEEHGVKRQPSTIAGWFGFSKNV